MLQFNRRGLFKSGLSCLFARRSIVNPVPVAATPAPFLGAPTLVPGVGELHAIDIEKQIFYFKDLTGVQKWMQNGKLHREDGPAMIKENGAKFWYLNGKRHREGGPAIEKKNGDKIWYSNGKKHRTDGPAREWENGDKEWWLNGERHREDGPAYEYDGDKFWLTNGERHRTDGPAIEHANGVKEWYLKGKEIPESVFAYAKPQLIGIKTNVALTSLRTQRLALGLTLRSFCKLNNLNPIEQRKLERAEKFQSQLETCQ